MSFNFNPKWTNNIILTCDNPGCENCDKDFNVFLEVNIKIKEIK